MTRSINRLFIFLLGFVYTTSYFLTHRLLYTPCLMAATVVSRVTVRVGIGPLISRHPWLALFTTMAGFGLLFSRLTRSAGEDGVIATVFTGIGLWLLLGCYVIAAFKIERYPSSHAEVSKRVAQRWPERQLAPLLRHREDAYFLRIMINNSLVVTPAWYFLLRSDLTYWTAVPVVMLFWAARCVVPSHETLDHINIHNRLFRVRDGRRWTHRLLQHALEGYLGWVLNPLCLRMPRFYRIQHLYVHHVEDNGPEDTQSTLPYDRLSYFDYCRSSLRIGLSWSTGADVFIYLLRHRRRRQARDLIVGVAGWYTILAGLTILHWPAALLVAVTKLLTDVAINSGVYSWHALVDSNDPTNPYNNTVNICPPSEGVFGGAYHIEHHLAPGLRWWNIAEFAERNRPARAAHTALDFWGEQWFGLAFLKILWTRRYDILASRCICPGAASGPEIERLIVDRCRPLQPSFSPAWINSIDELAGQLIAKYLIIGKVDDLAEPQRAALQEARSRSLPVA